MFVGGPRSDRCCLVTRAAFDWKVLAWFVATYTCPTSTVDSNSSRRRSGSRRASMSLPRLSLFATSEHAGLTSNTGNSNQSRLARLYITPWPAAHTSTSALQFTLRQSPRFARAVNSPPSYRRPPLSSRPRDILYFPSLPPARLPFHFHPLLPMLLMPSIHPALSLGTSSEKPCGSLHRQPALHFIAAARPLLAHPLPTGPVSPSINVGNPSLICEAYLPNRVEAAVNGGGRGYVCAQLHGVRNGDSRTLCSSSYTPRPPTSTRTDHRPQSSQEIRSDGRRNAIVGACQVNGKDPVLESVCKSVRRRRLSDRRAPSPPTVQQNHPTWGGHGTRSEGRNSSESPLLHVRTLALALSESVSSSTLSVRAVDNDHPSLLVPVPSPHLGIPSVGTLERHVRTAHRPLSCFTLMIGCGFIHPPPASCHSPPRNDPARWFLGSKHQIRGRAFRRSVCRHPLCLPNGPLGIAQHYRQQPSKAVSPSVVMFLVQPLACAGAVYSSCSRSGGSSVPIFQMGQPASRYLPRHVGFNVALAHPNDISSAVTRTPLCCGQRLCSLWLDANTPSDRHDCGAQALPAVTAVGCAPLIGSARTRALSPEHRQQPSKALGAEVVRLARWKPLSSTQRLILCVQTNVEFEFARLGCTDERVVRRCALAWNLQIRRRIPWNRVRECAVETATAATGSAWMPLRPVVHSGRCAAAPDEQARRWTCAEGTVRYHPVKVPVDSTRRMASKPQDDARASSSERNVFTAANVASALSTGIPEPRFLDERVVIDQSGFDRLAR
ncbi:hypothetical protein LXA43DRAFT_1060577 [Ganoderma leucocontextum]|nr:hypothetical protein LXA43DRAFT_1060577 [Ganoderma leucocontextum]